MPASRKAAKRSTKATAKKPTKKPSPAKTTKAPARVKSPKVPPAPKTPPPIDVAVEIHAPAHRVWAALTSPDEVNRWFTDRCEFEARPNGRVLYAWFANAPALPAYVTPSRFGFAAEGRIEAWEPRRRFAFRPTSQWPGLVTFRVEEHSDRTRASVTHEGWPEADDYHRALSREWTDALHLLKLYLEKPEAEFDAYLAKIEARTA